MSSFGSAGKLPSTGVSGMEFATAPTQVDAMSGHPHVVTMGVREQVVKPATECAGIFAMSSLPISSPPGFSIPRAVFGIVPAALLLVAAICLPIDLAAAGSATAQLRVGARVVRSCRVSTQALLEQQNVKSNGPVNVNCDKNVSSSATAPEPVRATVTYTWLEGSAETDGTKVVTLNF